MAASMNAGVWYKHIYCQREWNWALEELHHESGRVCCSVVQILTVAASVRVCPIAVAGAGFERRADAVELTAFILHLLIVLAAGWAALHRRAHDGEPIVAHALLAEVLLAGDELLALSNLVALPVCAVQ